MYILKVVLIGVLIMVLIQDVRERKVYWFWFPIIALCAGTLLYRNTIPEMFYITLLVNLAFVAVLLLVVMLYAKLKLKTAAANTFGLGDALLFLTLAFTFYTVPFIILFVFGLLFSLLLHLVVKHKSKHHTVPLAGYLSLFFAIAYVLYWLGITESVYAI